MKTVYYIGKTEMLGTNEDILFVPIRFLSNRFILKPNSEYNHFLFRCDNTEFILLHKLGGNILNKVEIDLDELEFNIYPIYDIIEGDFIPLLEASRRLGRI